MNQSLRLFLFLIGAITALSLPAHAQRTNLSARESLGLVSSQFGPQAVQWVAEMRAQGGIPQPSDWQILAYDSRAPKLLYRFWAGGGRAGDGGIENLRYPDDVPFGYFTSSQIGVDSVAAFTIAEGEARKARMAFDSCDYLLRLREYSTEPVWRLELLDATRRLVGKLYISAGNGQVLRTIWVYRDQRARPDGEPLIIDSLAPGGQVPPTDLSGSGYNLGGQSPLGGISSIPPASTTIPGRIPGQVPGMMTGIHSVPLPPAPGVAVAGNAPYAPVDATGRPMTAPSVGDGIPSPPPLVQTPTAPVAPVASIPAPAPSSAPEPTKPPLNLPPSSGGNSERIPPPPIPR